MKKLFILTCCLFSGLWVNAQDWLWVQQFNESNADRGVRMATDSEGYTTMIGSFQGADLVWGSDTLGDISSLDYFVAQADPDGQPTWALHGISKLEKFNFVGTFYDIDVDAQGDIYLAGTFVDTLRLGDKMIFSQYADSLNNSQIFYAKVSKEGKVIYLKNADSQAYSWCTSITHANGRTYISGTYRETIEVDGRLYDSGTRTATAYIAEIDNQGAILWLNRLPSISSAEVAEDGRIHLSGSFSDTIRLGGSFIQSPFRRNFYYGQMTGDGDWIPETIQYGSVGSNENGDRLSISDLEINENGEAALTGFFSGSYLEVGGEFVASTTDKTQFVVKFGASGSVQWAKDAGGIQGSWVVRPDLAMSGERVFFCSTFEDKMNLTGEDIFSRGGTDIIMIVFGGTGEVEFIERYGDTSFDFGYGITIDPQNHVTLFGNYNNFIRFDGDLRLISNGTVDVFLAKADFSEIVSIESIYSEYLPLQVEPNPTSDLIRPSTNMPFDACKIYNGQGRLVFSKPNLNSSSVDIGTLPSGTYHVCWKMDQSYFISKVVKN